MKNFFFFKYIQDPENSKTDDLDLTGIDDNEIESMLLSKDEIRTKAKLWLRANKDWLKEQKGSYIFIW